MAYPTKSAFIRRMIEHIAKNRKLYGATMKLVGPKTVKGKSSRRHGKTK